MFSYATYTPIPFSFLYLTVGAEQQRLLVFGFKLFLHQLRPQQASRAQLGNFHVKIHANAEEEREPRRDVVDLEPGRHGAAHVLDAVGDGEGQLKLRVCACFLHVIAADADAVVLGHVLRRERKDVLNDSHAWRGWVNVGIPHHELLWLQRIRNKKKKKKKAVLKTLS